MMKTFLNFHHAAKLLLSFLLFGASALAQTTATVTVLGGEQSSGGVWDSGDVTIEVSGTNGGSLSRTVPYGQFSTPASVAAGLAALISRECYGVASAKADGATITFHLRYAAAAPINITAGTPHWDGAHFTSASFGFSAQQTVTPTQVTLTGNAGEFVAPNTQISLSASIAQSGATGAMEFYDRGSLLGASVISGSQANYTTPPLAAGVHELYAKYTGDSGYAGSTSNTVYATAAEHSGPAVGTSMYWYSITDSSNNSGYAANSNVVAYNDAVMGQWSLGYDSLNRLSSGNAQTGPVPSQVGSYFCWSYDSFGNRLSQVVANQGFSVSNGSSCQSNGVLSQTWTNYDGNNRITSTNAPNYSAAPVYDNGGNITNDGRNLYLYDGEGRVCAVQAPSPVAGLPMVMQQYIYDAEGRRVAKGTISSWSCNTDTNGFVQTTAYVDGPDGGQMTEMSVAANGTMTWVHTNVTAGGKLIATYQNDNGGTSPETGKLHFALNDWLGTKRVQAAHDGTLENSWVSLPFGEVPPAPPGGSYAAPDATEQHFTGKERDAESGLDYFGARYYASTTGRFISPDPMQSSEKHLIYPQRWNAYAYVQNNPLNAIDPDGWDDFKIFINFNPGQLGNKEAALEKNWFVIAAQARANGHTVEFMRSTVDNYTAALQSDSHVIDAGHTYDATNPTSAVFMKDETNVGAAFVGSSPEQLNFPVPDNVTAKSVDIFGCDSAGLAPQYAKAGAFVGVDSGPDRSSNDITMVQAAQAFLKSATSLPASKTVNVNAAAQAAQKVITNSNNYSPDPATGTLTKPDKGDKVVERYNHKI